MEKASKQHSAAVFNLGFLAPLVQADVWIMIMILPSGYIDLKRYSLQGESLTIQRANI